MASWSERRWLLPLMWLAAVVVVNPIGNFPLNDDWSYALNVRNWVDGGVFKFNDWAAMTQLTHILLGIGVTEWVGFSHTALRFVTLGVVLLWIVGAHGMRPWHLSGRTMSGRMASAQNDVNQSVACHENQKGACHANEKGACHENLKGACHAPLRFALIFNPLFFSLSFTFMTDVLFVILFLVSMDLLVREKWGWGTVFAVLATLTRQTGVGIGLSMMATVGAHRMRPWKMSGRMSSGHASGQMSGRTSSGRTSSGHASGQMSGRMASAPHDAPQKGACDADKEGACHAPLRMSIVVSIILISVLGAYSVIMSHFGVISGNYNTLGDLLWILDHERPLARMAANAALVGVYLGLFTLPVLPLAWRRHWNSAPWWVFAGITVVLFGLTWGRFPMTHDGNLLFGWGIGPILLTGGNGFESPWPWMGVWLQGMGAAGGGVLAVAAWNALRDPQSAPIIRWGVVVMVGFTLFILINQFFFDRYFLLLVPFALWVMAPESTSASRRARITSWVLIGIMAAYSILGTRQYLDVNRERWAAVESLMDGGVTASDIDGGFEVNKWFGNESPQDARFVIGVRAPANGGLIAEYEYGLGVWDNRESEIRNQ